MANEKIAKQAEIELILQRLAQYKKVWGETIVGTQTAATGTWTGVSKLATASDLISGYRFTYWLPYSGSGNATLRLTFQDGTTKDIIPYIYNNTRLTTHIGYGNSIDFVYLENANVNGTMYTGAWVCKNYEADNYDRNLSNYERRFICSAATPLYRYKICGYNGGKLVPLTITDQTTGTIVQKTPVSVGIDPAMGLVWYYNTTDVTAITTAVGTLYDEMPGTVAHFTFNDTVPVYHDVYLKGEIRDDGLFYLDTTTLKSWYVFAPQRTSDGEHDSVFEEGCHYMYVGPTFSSANYVQLKLKNPVYIFTNGALRNVNGTLPPGDAEDEFLYRKTPFVGDMMSVSGVKGRTIVWNQLVQNGDFGNTSNWIANRGTFSVENNIGSFSVTSNGDNYCDNNVSMVVGHNYLFIGDSNSPSPNNQVFFIFFGSARNVHIERSAEADTWERHTYFFTCVTNQYNFVRLENTKADTTNLYRNIRVIDLTLMFGAGNEPETVEEFEEMFPLPYYDYNAGTLISNNARAVETVGRNLWDEEWEVGTYNTSTGEKTASTTQIRSKNLIPVIPGKRYFINASYGNSVCYDSSKNYISTTPYSYASQAGMYYLDMPSNAYYISFYMTSAYGTTYRNNICINLSDPSFDGQYEPYKRTELGIGLDSFDVVSPNIWDEEWEHGTIDSSTGEKIPATTNNVRSKNYIPVTPGKTYYVYVGSSNANANLRIRCYGANKEYLGENVTFSVKNSTITIGSGCYYILFYAFQQYGTTYNNDICINETASTINGKYFPHGTTTIEGGLKSAGSAYDEIVGDKYIKRIGSVDLGTMTWKKSSVTQRFFSADLTNQIPLIGTADKGNLTCSRYTTTTYNDASGNADKCCYGFNGGDGKCVAIDDSSLWDSSTADQFKAAMSGVMLYYELATPEEYTLVKPFPTGYAEIPQGGQQKVLPENTSSSVTTAPLRATFTYTTAAPVSRSALKLQDSHDIWGQPFDGTKDVTGAMTGVTSIKNATAPSLIEWDDDKGAWHFKGSLYADGWISALGVGSDSSSTTDLPEVWASLSGHTDAYKDTPIDWAHIVVNRSVTGSGNVVSDVTLTPAADGKSATLAVTKTQVSTDWADITNKPSTLSGYGISDAYIVGNTIHLGQYSELTALTEHQPIFSLTVNNAAGDAITTYNPASDTATLNLTAAAVGLGNVQNVNVTTWATITGNTDKTIKLGSSSVTIPAWAMSLNTLEGSLDQVYHPKFGDLSMLFKASTLTVAETLIGGSVLVGNNNLTNAKIYFGSTGSYLELKNIGTTQSPSYALHSNLPFYSDSWISALGEGEGGSSGGGGGVDNHVLISEEEFENMTTFDDGKIYLVYEDEEA